LKIKFLIFNNKKIQPITKDIAMAALMIDDNNESKLLNPEIERGPITITKIPPPKRIKIHMKNKNT
jgi:hypothetical protein